MANQVAKACSEASLTLEDTKHPELVTLLQMAATELERIDCLNRTRSTWTVSLRDANDLLRSAYQIASRSGLDTNWPAFTRRIAEVLVQQSVLINGSALLDAATCTPKTFRLPTAE